MQGQALFHNGFRPPREWRLSSVVLSPLGIDDLAPDYEAVVESAEALRGLFAADDPWPEGLTERADLIDLAWHEREFLRGTSYAWGLREATPSKPNAAASYLGSAYLYRDPTGVADIHAVHWFRRSFADAAVRVGFRAEWEAWSRALPGVGSVRFSQT